MAWATVTDVTDRWVGSSAPTDVDLVNALIADAEAVVLAKYPKIQDRINADTLPLSTVVMVVCRMVSRVLRNPEGLSYVQQATGPFSQAKNYAGSASDIWMSADEIELLSPNVKGKAFQRDLGAYAVPGYEVGRPPSETSFGATYFMNDIED